MTNKKAFDLACTSVYVADPTTELRIIGGRCLAKDEIGSLDTDPDPSHPLSDLHRLKRPLPEMFVKNIDFRGVDVPIRIVKLDDVATVIDGKTRVRAARLVNQLRIARGEQPIKIKCVIQRDTAASALSSSVVSANNARIDDSFFDKLEKAKKLIDLGIAEDDVAMMFCVGVHTIRGWLAFDDGATDETKQAVKDGRIGATVAAELARITDPDEQRARLSELVTAPDGKAKSVKAARQARGAKGSAALTGKKDQVRLLERIRAMSHGSRSEKTIAFWHGAEEMLKLVLGDKEADDRLKEALRETRAAAKKEI